MRLVLKTAGTWYAGHPMSPGVAVSAAEQAVQGQLAVTEQLVMDVTQDEEVYQQAFPHTSPICLATISCRLGTAIPCQEAARSV